MKIKALIMDEKAINRAIVRIAHEIIEKNKGVENLVLIGIESKGWPLALKLQQKIEEIEGVNIPAFPMDISGYRDDIKYEEIEAKDIELPNLDILDKTVVLVDDVLYTGRTVRAALDAVVDRGRPKLVELAVLIDRGHRELPIRADFIGKNVPTSRSESVKVALGDNELESKVVIVE